MVIFGPIMYNGYSACHINAHSLTTTHRIYAIEDFISVTTNFDIVAIWESQLDSKMSNSSIYIPNYSYTWMIEIDIEVRYVYTLKNP